MMKSRFTETQIVSLLGEADASMKVNDLCRKHGLSPATYY
jgi:putative transposase